MNWSPMESLCTTFVDVHNVLCIQIFQKSQRAEKLYVAVLPIIGKEQHKSNTDIAYIYCNYSNVLPESLRNKKESKQLPQALCRTENAGWN